MHRFSFNFLAAIVTFLIGIGADALFQNALDTKYPIPSIESPEATQLLDNLPTPTINYEDLHTISISNTHLALPGVTMSPEGDLKNDKGWLGLYKSGAGYEFYLLAPNEYLPNLFIS